MVCWDLQGETLDSDAWFPGCRLAVSGRLSENQLKLTSSTRRLGVDGLPCMPKVRPCAEVTASQCPHMACSQRDMQLRTLDLAYVDDDLQGKAANCRPVQCGGRGDGESGEFS